MKNIMPKFIYWTVFIIISFYYFKGIEELLTYPSDISCSIGVLLIPIYIIMFFYSLKLYNKKIA